MREGEHRSGVSQRQQPIANDYIEILKVWGFGLLMSSRSTGAEPKPRKIIRSRPIRILPGEMNQQKRQAGLSSQLFILDNAFHAPLPGRRRSRRTGFIFELSAL
ncbi:hypothetical protein GCM10022631_08930 [Deinococcus rubellus]